MPYIALQLVGLEAVLRTMGINGTGFVGHLPLFIAFLVLALYTYKSGLRAPALIAFVKDILIYIVIMVAVIYLPAKLGGWAPIFEAASDKLAQPNPATGRPQGSILLTANNQLQYATLALGSALALFLYPHSATGILASRGRNVIKRNMMALPAYSLLLGLLALLGYVAIAAGAKPITNNATGRPDSNTIMPVLFDTQFNSLFAGIAFAAIGIGALVPAAIMSIAAANLWTRNIYKEYLQARRHPGAGGEAGEVGLAGGQVRCGGVHPVRRPAVLHRPAADRRRDHPADAAGRRHRALHPVAAPLALIAGWVVGMGWGLYLLYLIPNPAAARLHFGGSALALDKLSLFGWHPFGGSQVQIYVGFVALVPTWSSPRCSRPVLRARRVSEGDRRHVAGRLPRRRGVAGPAAGGRADRGGSGAR